MRWASSLSCEPQLDGAVEECLDQLRSVLGDEAPDLLFAFASDHALTWDRLPAHLGSYVGGGGLVGCTAAGVIGKGREIEDGPGLSLLAARLPGVEVTPFHLDATNTPPQDASREAWLAALGLAPGPDPHLVLMPDPFTCDPARLISELDAAFPVGVCVGGLVSGSLTEGSHRMFCRRSTHHRGAVGVALRGNLELDTIVAQGCRPIGNPMFVTRRRENLVLELDGGMALEAMRKLLEQLDDDDLRLARQTMFIGVALVSTGGVDELGPGDFLIRNLIGVDPKTGGIGVAELLPEHAVIQFHVRDAAASDTDLRTHLMDVVDPGATQAALHFTCMGRGRHLYGAPDHESDVLREHLGDIPTAGFFCNGEIGPVQRHTHLHGYTSAIGIVRDAARQ